ncbi:cold-shock protein [Nocardia iowensis]|uniref:Cold-shock protein n=1 Tax=Nocardia iowensis TaxID=204891 RepID=A0ABX8RKU8_NOCIO|nr:cold-shock protein [Nocardia iowensis]QXN90249.1 cold-shock protein [Nocardia iowensis]
MTTGTVKWFNPEKGIGMISPDDGGPDTFVHHSDVNASGYMTLEEGQLVTFDAVAGPKGPQAKNVTMQ